MSPSNGPALVQGYRLVDQCIFWILLKLFSVLFIFNFMFRAERSLRPFGQPWLSPHNSDNKSPIVSFVLQVLHLHLVPREPCVSLLVKCLTAAKVLRIPTSFSLDVRLPFGLLATKVGPSGLFGALHATVNACLIPQVYSPNLSLSFFIVSYLVSLFSSKCSVLPAFSFLCLPVFCSLLIQYPLLNKTNCIQTITRLRSYEVIYIEIWEFIDIFNIYKIYKRYLICGWPVADKWPTHGCYVSEM